jgi:hypothetical protein
LAQHPLLSCPVFAADLEETGLWHVLSERAPLPHLATIVHARKDPRNRCNETGIRLRLQAIFFPAVLPSKGLMPGLDMAPNPPTAACLTGKPWIDIIDIMELTNFNDTKEVFP